MKPASIFRLVFVESMILASMGLVVGLLLALPFSLWMQANPIELGGEMAGMTELVGMDPVLTFHLAPSSTP